MKEKKNSKTYPHIDLAHPLEGYSLVTFLSKIELYCFLDLRLKQTDLCDYYTIPPCSVRLHRSCCLTLVQNLHDGTLEQYLKENPHIESITFCLDNDQWGREAIQRQVQ